MEPALKNFADDYEVLKVILSTSKHEDLIGNARNRYLYSWTNLNETKKLNNERTGLKLKTIEVGSIFQ